MACTMLQLLCQWLYASEDFTVRLMQLRYGEAQTPIRCDFNAQYAVQRVAQLDVQQYSNLTNSQRVEIVDFRLISC